MDRQRSGGIAMPLETVPPEATNIIESARLAVNPERRLPCAPVQPLHYKLENPSKSWR